MKEWSLYFPTIYTNPITYVSVKVYIKYTKYIEKFIEYEEIIWIYTYTIYMHTIHKQVNRANNFRYFVHGCFLC